MPKEITKDEFKAAYPDLFKVIVDEAAAQGLSDGLTQGKAQGMAEGIKAEQERIKSVEAQMLPGHEALISSMKFDGKTSGPEAAVKVLAAEKEIQAKANADFNEDGQGVKAPVVNPPAVSVDAKVDENAPLEERIDSEWLADANIRTEFNNNKAAYLAFRRAEDAGLAKIYKGGN